jgi:hypothetical protein
MASFRQSHGGSDSLVLPPGSREVLDAVAKGILLNAWTTQVDHTNLRGEDCALRESESGRKYTEEFWDIHAPELIYKVNEGLSRVSSSVTWNSIVSVEMIGRKSPVDFADRHRVWFYSPRNKASPINPRKDAKTRVGPQNFQTLGAAS